LYQINRINNSPILISGCPRSGTTWVGKGILDELHNIQYIHEPFNLNRYRDPEMYFVVFNNWFKFINEINGEKYYNHLKKTFSYQYRLSKSIKKINSLRSIKNEIKKYIRILSARLFNKRPLVKDPIAIFSAEWLAKNFNMEVIILIRHPAAVVNSFKRLNWNHHNIQDFINQPLLIKNCLSKFEDEIQYYINKPYDLIEQISLHWKYINYQILQYKKKYDNWLFIRHEDLSRFPVKIFKNIFNKLDLNFNNKIKNKITKMTSKKNPITSPNNSTHYLYRNSKANIYEWKNNLNSNEINKIRSIVEPISNEFYDKNEW